MMTAIQILEDILRNEDTIDRTARGENLCERLWNTFLFFYNDDKAEAQIAAITFFVKVMAQMTTSQRDRVIELLQVCRDGLDLDPDIDAFCAFIRDKLGKTS